MAVKRKTIHNLVMREIFVSRAGELSRAGDRPKYREPPAQVVRVNRYAFVFQTHDNSNTNILLCFRVESCIVSKVLFSQWEITNDCDITLYIACSLF